MESRRKDTEADLHVSSVYVSARCNVPLRCRIGHREIPGEIHALLTIVAPLEGLREANLFDARARTATSKLQFNWYAVVNASPSIDEAGSRTEEAA